MVLALTLTLHLLQTALERKVTAFDLTDFWKEKYMVCEIIWGYIIVTLSGVKLVELCNTQNIVNPPVFVSVFHTFIKQRA